MAGAASCVRACNAPAVSPKSDALGEVVRCG